jgi:hypothetical protein
LANYYLFLFLIAQRLSSAMAYGLAFQNYSQHMLPKNLTCSDRRLYSFDFISHAERKMLKNGGDDDGEMMMGASASDTSTGD